MNCRSQAERGKHNGYLERQLRSSYSRKKKGEWGGGGRGPYIPRSRGAGDSVDMRQDGTTFHDLVQLDSPFRQSISAVLDQTGFDCMEEETKAYRGEHIGQRSQQLMAAWA